MTAVFTVIVTYNALTWIDQCIASVIQESTIIIVDNNSKDETVTHIKNKYPEVLLLPQDKNLGFGKGNNLGISLALQKGASQILLLNQDAKMKAGSLATLLKFQKENKQYGLVSPIHCDWSGNFMEASFSRYCAYENTPNFYSDFVLNKKLKPVYEIPMVAAACWLLSKDTLEQVGGFDPLFFHLGEDNNLCQRILFHGFKIGVLPNTFVMHDTKDRKEKAPIYSEKYLTKMDYRNKAKYADVTIANPLAKMKYKQRQLFKDVLFHVFTLHFKQATGAYKAYTQFKKMVPKAMVSIVNNKSKGKHYL